MPKGAVILIGPHHGSWHVGFRRGSEVAVQRLALEADAAPAEVAAALLGVVGTRGGDATVLVAVPTEQCMTAVVPTGDLPARSWRQPLVYRLEEHLPVAVEEVVADFVVHGPIGRGMATGVAVELTAIQPLIDALEAQGMMVPWVCPAITLAMQSGLLPLAGARSLLWQTNGHVQAIDLQDQQMVRWRTCGDEQELVAHLRYDAIERDLPLSVAAVGLRSPAVDAVAAIAGEHLEQHAEIDWTNAVCRGGLAVAEEAVSAQLNLRRGALKAPSPLNRVRHAIVAALLCFGLLAVVLLFGFMRHASLHEQRAEQAEQAVADIHESLLGEPPHDDTPAALVRLTSERRRLQAISGQSTQALPSPVAALNTLEQVLSALPKQVRYQIFDLHIDEQRLALDGVVRSHADADLIATALRSGTGFRVDPPHTHAQPHHEQSTVSFRISGTRDQVGPATQEAAR